MIARFLAEIVNPETSPNLPEFTQGKLDDFFFAFNNLLNDLIHISSVRYVALLIGYKPTRFSADKRVKGNVNVTCGKRQAQSITTRATCAGRPQLWTQQHRQERPRN
jgi:hypothetical protein